MSGATIIGQAADDGVTITASSTGHLKLRGEKTAINRWVLVVREHKPDIMAALQTDPAVIAIRRWLAYIGETHQPIIEEVMEMIATDPAALAYYLTKYLHLTQTMHDELVWGQTAYRGCQPF